MTTPITRKAQTGEPTTNPGHFGTVPNAESDVALTPIVETMNTLDFDGPLKRMNLQAQSRSVDHFVSGALIEDLHLDAPYQRASVWSEAQRQNLIRSVLQEIPFGSIIVNRCPDVMDGYNVIDGKQRIEALRAFVASEFPIPASWVDPARITSTEEVDGWPVPGVRYNTLDVVFGRFFSRRGVSTIEASVATIEEEAAIFRLINSAGVAQTDETLAAAAAVENRTATPHS
jgi:hypothetical protein